MPKIQHHHYLTRGGVRVNRQVQVISSDHATDDICRQLDSHRGVLLSSSVDYPGRYSRWDIGFVNPPLVITARGRKLQVQALNRRGEILLVEVLQAVQDNVPADVLCELAHDAQHIAMTVREASAAFSEEQRSRQPSVFSVLRAIIAHFHSDADAHLGLYGAFGYDLAFQFEPVRLNRLMRTGVDDDPVRDMVLYLPDELVVVDHHSHSARRICYDFVCRRPDHTGVVRDSQELETTGGLRRSGVRSNWVPSLMAGSECDHEPGEYAETVKKAITHFRQGRLFEAVPGQTFRESCHDSPSRIFQRLRRDNPAPYGALMNLGEQEYLVAASPEMYVRVRGDQVETCPISGTIARGEDAIGDARQILALLNSKKDESELSMCTDVDRNDKARVCVPGSVKVIGRRQVELYSRLIHTVDHVKGTLADGFDALDAFLAHTWAVTVTGAPKADAMQFIEDNEKSPRRWYGGAMGFLGFDGNMNTGLTLRTVRIRSGVAEVRVGATLLVDSDPLDEEAETHLKASALLAALRDEPKNDPSAETPPVKLDASSLEVLMVDHRDSFVHSLGACFREHGVRMTTLRPMLAQEALQRKHYDLVILSPGPGVPDDHALQDTLAHCLASATPVFGVCLGLQGIVEYFGGELSVLDYPMHGKSTPVTHTGADMFVNLPLTFDVGRYHSLHATAVPDCLRVTAHSSEPQPVVMAVEHRVLPVRAVQFHPESILSLGGQSGQRLVANIVAWALQYQTAVSSELHKAPDMPAAGVR